MCEIPGVSYNKLYLVRGLCSPHAQQRVASKQDTWHSIEDVIQTIDCVTRPEEENRALFNPNLEASRPVIQVNKVSYGKATWQYMSDHPIIINPTQHGSTIHPVKTISSQGAHSGKAQDIKPISMVLRKYCATTAIGST